MVLKQELKRKESDNAYSRLYRQGLFPRDWGFETSPHLPRLPDMRERKAAGGTSILGRVREMPDVCYEARGGKR